jgi:glycosyltransferase involved in cell wall biosynthesis
VISIVIPAHNEANRIGTNLAQLTGEGMDGFEIIVVPNGCTDATAAVAADFPGVQVIDLPDPGKAAALRAGDRAAKAFPRIYLDADIALSPAQVRALAAAVELPGVLAATGERQVSTRGSSLLVRAFYAVNKRLPAYQDALYGRGVIALSETGRARFGEFPDQVADDLFLDSMFSAQEKCHEPAVVTTIDAPRRTAHLVRRLARLRSGNRALRATESAPIRPARNSSWLKDVVLPRPWLWPAGLCYAAIVVIADLSARRAGQVTWGHQA